MDWVAKESALGCRRRREPGGWREESHARRLPSVPEVAYRGQKRHCAADMPALPRRGFDVTRTRGR
jgi:hypothetical protein